MKNYLGTVAVSCVLAAGLIGGCSSSSTDGPSGKVVQGPVSGALVIADQVTANRTGNFSLDPGELSANTGPEGNYSLSAMPSYSYVLVSEGGNDIFTGLPGLLLAAPAGAGNVSPITTMVALASTPAEAKKVKDIIESLGMAYDADISVSATPAGLMLAKSIETIQGALVAAVGDSASASQKRAMQARMAQSMAQSLGTAVPADLRTSNRLRTMMESGVTAGINNVNAASIGINVPPDLGNIIAGKAVALAAEIAGSSPDSDEEVGNGVVMAEKAQIEKFKATNGGTDSGENVFAEQVKDIARQIKDAPGFVTVEMEVDSSIEVITEVDGDDEDEDSVDRGPDDDTTGATGAGGSSEF